MNNKLLLVEPSATMRYVLQDFAQTLGYEVEAVEAYTHAHSALKEQFRAFEGDYAGVMLGWPAIPDASADKLTQLLEQEEYADLPVVVMSTDMRSSTRAWVSGRETTSLLSWKDYQNVEGQLARMLSPADSTAQEVNPKFDNSDIHLLVVDDSISIRYALRDLFELQGYRVTLASTHEEAVDLARSNPMDLAILDFYLQEGSGDVLCRELTHDPATGNITCAMLTGTYSDHIIKRSLRAGAVECMFKNESSELILSRVDALSRMIRQREALLNSRVSLDKIVDTIAGATILVNDSNRISYVSPKALGLLKHATDEQLMGQPISTYLADDSIAGEDNDWREVVWTASEEDESTLQLRKQPMGNGNEVLLYLQSADTTDSTIDIAVSNNNELSIASAEEYRNGAGFVGCLGEYLMQQRVPDGYVSMLLIEVDNQDQSLGYDDYQIVENELLDIYTLSDHMARIGNNRYGFILRHSSQAEAYMMTRKLMQLCNDIELPEQTSKLNTKGCLVGLARNSALNTAELLQRVSLGLNLVAGSISNQALMLDIQKMLPMYPDA